MYVCVRVRVCVCIVLLSVCDGVAGLLQVVLRLYICFRQRSHRNQPRTMFYSYSGNERHGASGDCAPDDAVTEVCVLTLSFPPSASS